VDGGVAEPQKHAPVTDVLYHTKFGRFRSNRLGVGIDVPNLGGRWDPAPLGRDVTDSPRNKLLSHLRYHVKFGHSMSNRLRVMDICQKILTLTPRLSRSLEIISIDTERSATYDFLCVP